MTGKGSPIDVTDLRRDGFLLRFCLARGAAADGVGYGEVFAGDGPAELAQIGAGNGWGAGGADDWG